jgi:nucleoside-diphosphate-sugar epimerase
MSERRRRVLVAGATGVVGRHLVPLLLARGHHVTALGRPPGPPGRPASGPEGPTRVAVDVLDRAALRAAVAAARPDVVLHQLTALGTSPGAAIGPRELVRTARIRREGTANLVAAALDAGAGRMVAQSVAWLYAPGPLPHGEDAPLLGVDPDGSPTLGGVRELERLVLTTPGLTGLVLRYGRFRGRGTGARRPPAPTVHVQAAARAAAQAVERGSGGVYNVTDDGGPVDNRRARHELGWSPTVHHTSGERHDRRSA